MDRYQRLVASLCEEIPGFRIVRKDQTRLHKAIHYALIALTFGRMRSYLDSFHTTIRKTVYVTADWDSLDADERYVTLRHEAVHLRQFRRFSLPIMGLLYLAVPLPAGLAYFRAYFEKQAYAETVRAAAEVWGIEKASSESYRNYVIGQFMGPSYGWMWPFRSGLERWYDQILSSIGEQR